MQLASTRPAGADSTRLGQGPHAPPAVDRNPGRPRTRVQSPAESPPPQASEPARLARFVHSLAMPVHLKQAREGWLDLAVGRRGPVPSEFRDGTECAGPARPALTQHCPASFPELPGPFPGQAPARSGSWPGHSLCGQAFRKPGFPVAHLREKSTAPRTASVTARPSELTGWKQGSQQPG